MLTLAQPRADPLPAAWRCTGCNRHLATVIGNRFERPNGDSGYLPAVIRCKCGTRNVKPRRS